MPKTYHSYEYVDKYGNRSYRYDTNNGNISVLLHEFEDYWWADIINNRGSQPSSKINKICLPGHIALQLAEILSAIRRCTKGIPYKNP